MPLVGHLSSNAAASDRFHQCQEDDVVVAAVATAATAASRISLTGSDRHTSLDNNTRLQSPHPTGLLSIMLSTNAVKASSLIRGSSPYSNTVYIFISGFLCTVLLSSHMSVLC